VNWEHLKAIVWLRQRLFFNWLRRSGIANTIVTGILMALGLVASAVMFFVALLLGIKLLPRATSDQLLVVWTAVIGAFLFSWIIGLLTELQRSEVISFQKLLYYPISLTGTFLVNYLSSFASFTLIIFLPAMIGLCIASVVALGPYFLVTLPMLFGLVLMVTAVTYQFRGWLASLMMNKRRRRTLVTAIGAAFILIVQLPNLFNRLYLRPGTNQDGASAQQMLERTQKLSEELKRHEISPEQAQARLDALQHDQSLQRKTAAEFKTEDVVRWVRIADLVIPPGWVAYGAAEASHQIAWPGLLGAVGLCLIGAVSLRRSYHTTLRFYRGDYESGEKGKKRIATRPPAERGTLLVERQLPWAPEEAAATAFANLRALIRAPEAKMMLLSLLIVGAIFGSTLAAGRKSRLPESFRPMMAMAIIAIETLSLSQIFQNQFGFDRDGFRTLLLSPARRRNILLGKNLSLAPLTLGSGAVALVILEFLYPLSITHFLASLVQLVSAYLMVCLVGNYTSILLPSAVRAGSFRSSTTTLSGSLLRVVAVFVLMTALGPLFLPLGIEFLLQSLQFPKFVPIYLILSLLELAVIAVLYGLLLEGQGLLLQSREQKILRAVTSKND
jgi:ABC-2 type transport system permease protein